MIPEGATGRGPLSLFTLAELPQCPALRRSRLWGAGDPCVPTPFGRRARNLYVGVREYPRCTPSKHPAPGAVSFSPTPAMIGARLEGG
jgi:hypothetical protein